MEDPSKLNSDDFGIKVIQNFMNLYFQPEINKRQQEKKLPADYQLSVAQIVFFPDGRARETRFDNEVKAIVKVQLKDAVAVTEGKPIYENQIMRIEKVSLLEEEADCGHATLFKKGNGYVMHFDFSYNKALSKKHIERAKEFFKVSKFCMENELHNAFIENLFATAELILTSMLLSWPDPKFSKKRTHPRIREKVSKTPVTQKYKDLLNKLGGERDSARYLKRTPSVSPDEAKKMYDTIENLLMEANE